MRDDFKIVTEELYKIFFKYPSNPKIDGCSCCVSNSHKAKLHSKPLNTLQGEDLNYYAFKAMTTFGSLEDFKHYLPRIFELAAKRKLSVDTFVILNKLSYGNWLSWNKNEIEAIEDFLKAWWKYDINHNEGFDVQIFIELNKLIRNLPQMLVHWNLEVETQGFKNFVDLIEDYYYDLKSKNRMFKQLNEKELNIFLSWIESNAYRLEEGFFKFDGINDDFSERISQTLYRFERIG